MGTVRTIDARAARGAAAQPSGKVHRGDLEIFDPSQLARLEGVTHVTGNLVVQVLGVPLSLPNLVRVDGEVNLGSDVAISLANLKSVKSLTIAGSPTTTRISLPKLEIATEGVNVSTASYPLAKLQVLELPRLRETASFVTAKSGLRKLSLPALKRVGSMQVSDSPRLQALELPALARVEHRIDVVRNPKLPSRQLDALVSQLVARGVERSKQFVSARGS